MANEGLDGSYKEPAVPSIIGEVSWFGSALVALFCRQSSLAAPPCSTPAFPFAMMRTLHLASLLGFATLCPAQDDDFEGFDPYSETGYASGVSTSEGHSDLVLTWAPDAFFSPPPPAVPARALSRLLT